MPVVTLTLVNSGHGFLRDLVTGADSPNNMFFALGNGTSTPTVAQTLLDNEQFRKRITSFVNGAVVGEALINCFVSDSDAVGLDIEEVAVFSGVTASATSNSGKMLGRALWSHNPKIATESLQLQLDIIL
ncbi:MAG: hypothetical protein ACRDHZ_00785 [Ktedonobacteraceae bacterium]